MGCPIHAKEGCQICGRPRQGTNEEDSPIDDVLPSPEWCEASFERMAELEHELEGLGIMGDFDQYEDEDEGGERSNSDLCFSAFNSGLCYDREGNVHYSWPIEMFPSYRGEMVAPKVWLMKQTKITDHFLVIPYDEYPLTLSKPSKEVSEPLTMSGNEEKWATPNLAAAGTGPLPFHNKNTLGAFAGRKTSRRKTSRI